MSVQKENANMLIAIRILEFKYFLYYRVKWIFIEKQFSNDQLIFKKFCQPEAYFAVWCSKILTSFLNI